MPAIAHPAPALALARQFTTSAVYQDAASIPASQFTAGRHYLIFARALLDQASTNNVAAVRMLHGANTFADSEQVDEPDTATTGKMQFFWFDRWIAVAGEGIKMQWHANTGTEAGIQAVVIVPIDVTDAVYLYNRPTPATVALAQDVDTASGNANLAFTILPEDAGRDFLVLSSARHQEVDLVVSYASKIVTTGPAASGLPRVIQEGEDGGLEGRQVKTLVKYLQALPAGDYTFAEKSYITGGAPTGGSRTHSKIMLLDLASTFRNYKGVYTEGELDLSAVDFATNLATLSGYTPDVAGDQLVLGFWVLDADLTGVGGKSRIRVDGVDAIANTTTNAYLQQEAHDARDEMGFGAVAIVNMTAAAHTITMDGSAEVAAAGRGGNYRSLVVMALETPVVVVPPEERPILRVPRPALDLDGDPELWTDVELNGGVRLGRIARVLAGPIETIGISGEHSVTLSTEMDHPIVRLRGTPADDSNLRVNQVIRLLKNDGTLSEHRIYESSRENRGGVRMRHIAARSIFQDLAFRGLVTRTTADGRTSATFEALGLPMETHLREFILPAAAVAGAPFWNIGGLENDLPYDMVYDRDTPMSAIRKLALAAGNLESWGEWSLTSYLLFLMARRGNLAPTLAIRAPSNLMSLQLTERTDDQATRVFVFGETREDSTRPSSGDATWDVTSVTPISVGWRITLADPAGGAGPVQFEDQFLPPDVNIDDPDTPTEEVPPRFHLDYVTGGDFLAPIIATDVADQSFDVETTATPPAGAQRVRIVGDVLRRLVLGVDHPAMVARYGVRTSTVDRPDIPGTDNLVANPIARLWPLTSPLPTGWDLDIFGNSAGQPTVQRESDPRFWQHGGQAVRVNFTDTSQNILFPLTPIPYRATGYLSYFVRLTTIRGRVQVWAHVIRNQVDPVTGLPTSAFPYIPPIGGFLGFQYDLPQSSGQFGAGDILLPLVENIQLNVSEDLGFAAAWDLSNFPLYGGTVQLVVQPHEPGGVAVGGTECVIEAGQITNTPSQMPLLEGNGGVRLHQAANERLATYATPGTSLSLDIVDLALRQGGRSAVLALPYTPLAVGGEVTIEDLDSDVAVATRNLGWTRDWSNRLLPQMQVSNERADITRTLAGRPKSGRHRVLLTPGGDRGRTFAP